MSDIEVREYFIEDPEMPHLFVQSWCKDEKEAKGCVLITHGISEHSECYTHVAEALAEQGWFVFAWDLQGHGRSEGKRGYIGKFTDFSDDLLSLIKKIKNDQKIPSSTFHLVGHSMGGLITLQCLLRFPELKITSVVLSNPALGIAVEVPKIKEAASHWLNQFWPTFTMQSEINDHLLSRDPAMAAKYEKDPLRHHKVSAPLFLGLKEAMAWVKEEIGQLKTPIFMQISGQDKITDAQASLNLFKKINCQKKLKIYEDSYHEIYNDLNKEEGIGDLIAYLGEHQQ